MTWGKVDKDAYRSTCESFQCDYTVVMPLLVKALIVNAFLLIGFFPFTRLVHILVIPNPYLWRRTQVVIWNWDRTRLRRVD